MEGPTRRAGLIDLQAEVGGLTFDAPFSRGLGAKKPVPDLCQIVQGTTGNTGEPVDHPDSGTPYGIGTLYSGS